MKTYKDFKKLNVGCGNKRFDDAWNTDYQDYPDNPVDEVIDITKPLPYLDNTFESIICNGVIPYVQPNKAEFIAYELCRVCSKPIVLKFNHWLGELDNCLNDSYTLNIGYGIEVLRRLDSNNRHSNSNWIQYKYDLTVLNIKIQLESNHRLLVKFVQRWVNKSYRRQRFWQKTGLGRLFPPRCVEVTVSKK